MRVKYYLEAEAWEIFAIVNGSLLISILLGRIGELYQIRTLCTIFSCIITIIGVGSWIYTLGKSLAEKSPVSTKISQKIFSLNLLIVFIYYIVFTLIFSHYSNDEASSQLSLWFGIIVVLQLYAMFVVVYTIYFISKALCSIEQNSKVNFGQFAGPFFLLLFFPIGIWYLQPRIKRIFSTPVAG